LRCPGTFAVGYDDVQMAAWTSPPLAIHPVTGVLAAPN